MSQTQNSTVLRSVITLVILVILGIAAYSFLTMPDHRSFTDRLGDAVHQLPNGVDKASEQMEDQTPGQKLGDAVKDTGQKLKDNTAPQ